MADLRILTVVGARPQFVKAAPISRAIAARDGIREILVHTGQHFDAGMSQIFFDELGLEPPRLDLGIHGGGHGEMTGKMLDELPLAEFRNLAQQSCTKVVEIKQPFHARRDQVLAKMAQLRYVTAAQAAAAERPASRHRDGAALARAG